MFPKLLVLVLILFAFTNHHVLGEVKYFRHELPPLYSFDNYEACFENRTTELVGSTYCMIYAEIQADHSNDISDFFESVHKRPLDRDMRSNYSQMIWQCLNREFHRKYQLELKTFVEYCERRPENAVTRAENDILKSRLYMFFKVLLLLVVSSTFTDYYLKSRQPKEKQTNAFFENNLEEPACRLLTSFSISRNYYRLTQPYRGEVGQKFAFLDGLRAVSTILVLGTHSYFLAYEPIENPQFFENFGKSTIGLMPLNCTVIIEIFMTMSGLLLYLKCSQGSFVTPQTSWSKCLQIYLLLMISRYVRFLPTLIALLGVNASLLKDLGDGPFWRHITEPGGTFSRENWWKNLLMINNFSPIDTANPHTWYLAADFQLFAFYTLLLIIIFKYPQYKKHILIGMSILTVAIPTTISYIFQLESSFMARPETYRYGYVKDFKLFTHTYTPFYTNLGGYLFGIVCGEIYQKYICHTEKRKIFSYLWIIVPLAAWFINYAGAIAIMSKASIWTALYTGLNRNLWIVFVCGIPILAMAFNEESLVSRFCRLPMFRVLARLSPQMYLWHCLVLYVTSAYHRQPQFVNLIHLINQGTITTTLSTVVAFFGYLFLEIPFSEICKVLLMGNKENRETQKQKIK
ncbi:nose resistant to fluoxetine protein 6-like [Musca vetustissima]|uniref:nose resistant to fluoxetine protein 6-like n=1 Tax=Musca vetustissima TaxID=27455 RepID=UPI002AB63A94|nr:nose resistant to fluoxetine protein 6-like [Musca vetustissima]